ncbi:Crp/Fnr family transcriptional regulator [Variovorax sp. PAMC 28711]|uniref:Crp/Fnr family transcriptional regulator n=1 Tax=Variovorax sp. PAMC 28711 TaxID=1795631 RepID=UPI00078EB263|nr:Crp/Fnr family transcriptional regulator [Variovorax sp. PAMC 28711]AMM23037.1 hypothetical protein AX767_00555 [Variovorax sp. PAMC 28711]
MTTNPPDADSLALMRNAIANSKLFARWTPDQIAKLARSASFRRYRRGNVVPTGSGADRQALLTVSGLLEISQTTSGGRRFVMGIVGGGEVAGLIRLFGNPVVEYGYVARDNAAVIHLPCAELMALLDTDPVYWRDLARVVLQRKVDAVAAVLDQVVIGGADYRIAATLQRLGKLFGVHAPQGTRLKLRLSQDDLADMLCVSRQTVNKELRRLEEMGVILCAYNTVTILDSDALHRIVSTGL